MNWVTIIWSLAAGACLAMALMNFLVWLQGRKLHAYLAFSVAALGVAGVAFAELSMLLSTDPQEYGQILKWAQWPVFFLLTGLAVSIRLYFGTGRLWLGITCIISRWMTLVASILLPVGVNYREIHSLKQVPFLGGTVSLVDEVVLNPWNRLAEISELLFLLFFIDATVALWRKGDRSSRHRALAVGGSLIFFIVVAAGHSTLIHLQVIQGPYVITFTFMATILAMGYSLGKDINSAAQTAIQLRESEQQLAMAAVAVKIAHWTWNIRENEIWVTDIGRSLYGVEAAEKVTIERFLHTLHPDDLERIQAALQNSLSGDGIFAEHYRVIPSENRIQWMSARGKVEFDEDGHAIRMRGVSIDVSDQHRAEEISTLLVEAAPYSMIMVDNNSNIVRVNHETERVFGYSRTELVGNPIDILVPDSFKGEHPKLRSEYMHHPQTRAMGPGRELSGRRKDGSEVPIEVGLNPLATAEGRYVLASVTDITQRRRLEQEAQDQRDALAHLSRVTSLGLLAGSLAHEINQPLGIILANAEAAQRILNKPEVDLQEIREIMDDIVSEDIRAGEAIKRLRGLLKRGETEIEPINPNEVISGVLRLTQSDLIRRSMSVATNLDPNLLPLNGDSVQIQQVLLNLILNGCDAMADNAPEDRVLQINTRQVNDTALISVHDRGTGLPDEWESKVFQPFFTTKDQGLGIGLSISHSIISAHHGRLWAEPDPDRGTTFYVELPSRLPTSA